MTNVPLRAQDYFRHGVLFGGGADIFCTLSTEDSVSEVEYQSLARTPLSTSEPLAP